MNPLFRAMCGAVVLAITPALGMAEDIPVFGATDAGRPPIDAFGTGLYSASCVAGAGCVCGPLPLNRDELAVVMGLAGVDETIQGIVKSPATDGDLTDEAPDALHQRYGGQGACSSNALVPEDGLWQSQSPYNIAVQCGEGTAMFQSFIANQPKVTARIAWNGIFAGNTVQAAFKAADPNADDIWLEFAELSALESFGTITLAQDGGNLTSSNRMQLLTPWAIRAHWDAQGMTEMGPCNWSTDQIVRWVGE